MTDLLTKRARVLADMGASRRESDELLAHNATATIPSAPDMQFPLADELFVAAWEHYARRVRNYGLAALTEYLVELSFPVSAGMSQDPEYVSATRRGLGTAGLPCASGLKWVAPERGSVVLHSTPAGRIPLLITTCREDFVSLVQALTSRNEPVHIPPAMGACMVRGYNNWDRINRIRREFLKLGGSQAGWQAEFAKIKTQKQLYQDCFIILSDGPYSNVAARDLGLEEQEWRSISLAIRREHECAHYFARRVFASACNSIIDEIIADYWGIFAARGDFDASWILRFFGLESFPAYRAGGRLENYRGNPPLSEGAFVILQRLVKQAVDNLARFHRRATPSLDFAHALLGALCSTTAEELAAADGVELLAARYRQWIEPKVRGYAETRDDGPVGITADFPANARLVDGKAVDKGPQNIGLVTILEE